MTDPHLNLFYTYNRDTELIENNLTRSFIVTLSLLPPELTSLAVRSILLNSTREPEQKRAIEGLELQSADFFLQSHVDIEDIQSVSNKFVLGISGGNSLYELEVTGEDYGSIPDAWILDLDNNYCVLVEAKIGSNPLDNAQITSHMKQWLGITKKTEMLFAMLNTSWNEIAETIGSMVFENENVITGSIEASILHHFLEFLGMYGYKHFNGFLFSDLDEPPIFTLVGNNAAEFSFDELERPPLFRLTQGSSVEEG
jgi:hypothetical protein